MSIRTSEEEKNLLERRNERKEAIKKYKNDFMSFFIMGIKSGSVALGAVIIIYLIAKWLFNWDLFYETDLDYTSIVFVVVIIFLVMVVLCCVIAFILYNTKHRRNTKYKTIDGGAGK